MIGSAARGEAGQTVVINILFLTVLIGFLGLVIDGGNAFLQRRNLQGVADAAALAGVQEVSLSQLGARAAALQYATVSNAHEDVDVRTIQTTGSQSGTCDGRSMAPYSVCVQVERTNASFLAQVVGVDSIRAGATAIASASQVYAMGKWLPIGLMDGAWTSTEQIDFEPGSADSPAGTINPDAGPSCKFEGANTIRQVAKSAKFGGEDACPLPVGSMIPTQTGGTNGPVLNGFRDRVGTNNTDSFEDVFEWSAEMGRYIVKLPDSPRIGIVPIREGSGTIWETQAGAEMKLVGYGIVYIGDRTKPRFPPTTGNGSRQMIHITPVDALMPSSWDVRLTSYDPLNRSPVVYRLVS